jgi:hypothetical protein
MLRFQSLPRLLAVVIAAGGLVACSGNSSDTSANTSQGPTPTTLANLRQRSLHIPHLNAAESCPVSPPRTLSPAFAPGLGDGPVYPIGFRKRSVLAFEYPPPKNSLFAGSKWGGQKVLWVSNPNYDGPILIRGRQLDGANPVRFGQGGTTLLHELAFRRGQADNWTGAWRNFPSYTRLRAPGCYAYQVDGAGISDIIVFRAIVAVS